MKSNTSWKDSIQTFGRSLLLPIALLAPIGMVMGICSAMGQSYMIEKFPFLGNGILVLIFSSLNTITSIVFNNIPLLFAMGVAQGMAKQEKGIAVFASVVGYLTLNVVMSVYLKQTGTLVDASVAAQYGQGTVLGIQTLKIEAMGGLISGLVAAKVANKFYRLELPLAFAFFGGKKSIPIITFVTMIPIGLVVPVIWNALTSFLTSISFIFTAPYIGSGVYYALNRALIPFGLHHVLASLVRFTEAGGTYLINGTEYVGILNATNEVLFNLGPTSEYWSQLMPTLTSYLGGAQMLTTPVPRSGDRTGYVPYFFPEEQKDCQGCYPYLLPDCILRKHYRAAGVLIPVYLSVSVYSVLRDVRNRSDSLPAAEYLYRIYPRNDLRFRNLRTAV